MPTAAVNLAAAQPPRKAIRSGPPPENDRSEAFEQALDDARRREGEGCEKTSGTVAKAKTRPATKKPKSTQTQGEETAVDEAMTGEQVEATPEKTADHAPTSEQPEEGIAQGAVSEEEGAVGAAAVRENGQLAQIVVALEAAVPEVPAVEVVGDETGVAVADGVDCSAEPAAAGAFKAVGLELPESAESGVAEDVPEPSITSQTSSDAPSAASKGTLTAKPLARPRGDQPDQSSQSMIANADQGAILREAEGAQVPEAMNVEVPEIQAAGRDPAERQVGGRSDSGQSLIVAAETPKTAPPPQATVSALSAEVNFARANHDPIVTGVRAHLLPHGGTMQIRLDPPELGALQVMVEMREGVMTATFQTSSDEATRLLSHSLNHLKHVLESQGVNVEKLQVQQAPKGEHSNAGEEHKQQQQTWSDEHAARQEQQRKELLRRMWRKVSGLSDPLDLVA